MSDRPEYPGRCATQGRGLLDALLQRTSASHHLRNRAALAAHTFAEPDYRGIASRGTASMMYPASRIDSWQLERHVECSDSNSDGVKQRRVVVQ